MPAIASIEDLRTAQKEGLGYFRSTLCFFTDTPHGHGHGFNRIGWKNVCGAPMGKGRAIQRLGGGDIPAPSEWSSLPGQVVVTGTYTGTIKRRRESVKSVRAVAQIIVV